MHWQPAEDGARRETQLLRNTAQHVAPRHDGLPTVGAAGGGRCARDEFERRGFLRLPSYFTADESEQMAMPVEAAHRAPHSPVADAAEGKRPSGSTTRFNFPDLHTGEFILTVAPFFTDSAMQARVQNDSGCTHRLLREQHGRDGLGPGHAVQPEADLGSGGGDGGAG